MHRPEERPRALRLVDGRCPARHPAYRNRVRPVFVTLDDCSGRSHSDGQAFVCTCAKHVAAHSGLLSLCLTWRRLSPCSLAFRHPS
jgi:hypothetical protein